MPDISVVIPVLNEEQNIRPLYAELKAVLGALGKTYEIIFVDDGSTDNSFDAIKDLCGEDRFVKAIRFARNYGQTAALAAGFRNAQGKVIVTLDSDLQNDPQDIPLLLNKLDEGYDIASGWRKNRKDPFWSKKFPSWIANFLISKITGVYLHDYGCTLKAYKREAISNMALYGEMHRFLPALASWRGVSIAEVIVNHRARIHGRTNYGLMRITTVLLDLITVKFLLSFSTKPIQLFGGWGISLLLLSGVSGVSVILMKFLQNEDMTGNPLLYLTILFLVVGIQFVMMGLLGEIMARIYHESQRHSTYVIKDKI